MSRSVRYISTMLAVAALGVAMLALPAVADAAKLRVKAGSVSVGDDGVAAVKLKNASGKRAKGVLKLKRQGKAVGSRRFAIRAHRSKTVKVELSVGAFNALEQGGDLRVSVVVRVAGRSTVLRTITLTLASGDGGSGGTPPPGGGGGPAWDDGRWMGTYADNNVDLAFNVVGTRLYTGPFDAFYLTATCHNADPTYTGDQEYTDSTAFEPVEAAIGGDGSFSGSGTYRPGYGLEMPWTISGHISGTSLTDGTFSSSYTDTRGNPCSGTTHFTASWYGDYIF